jgi:hypothetical protein
MVGRWVDRLVGQLPVGLVGWFIDWWVSWVGCGLVGGLAGWLLVGFVGG